MIEVSWPGQPFLDRTIAKGDVLLVTGNVRFFHGRQLQPREYINLGDEENAMAEGRVLSVYPATEGLSFKVIRSIVDAHIDALLPLVNEYLPADVLGGAGVPGIATALRMVHRPTSIADAMQGRSRLAFEELFFVQILQQRAKELAREHRAGIAFENKRKLTTALRESLPFQLTGAQTRATREIFADMCSDRRMQRLLQGDVGSGKTIVALFAALLAIENGYQAALMVPTELLAEQHARTMTSLVAPLGVASILLTGSLATREAKGDRRAVGERGAGSRRRNARARARIDGIRVARPCSHRRAASVRRRTTQTARRERREARCAPAVSDAEFRDRSSLTLYGDLDVCSILDERPPGRKPITTALRRESARARVFQFVDRQLEQGRQGYIVYPVIEESGKELTCARRQRCSRCSRLARSKSDWRRAFLHGRIPNDQRDDIMRRFRDGEIDLLVATTVIEVGIDVPNATVMVVEHPERFGLSQLHQLRGRVGRGAAESYCILLGDVSPPDVSPIGSRSSPKRKTDLRSRARISEFAEWEIYSANARAAFRPSRIADPIRDEELNSDQREGRSRTVAGARRRTRTPRARRFAASAWRALQAIARTVQSRLTVGSSAAVASCEPFFNSIEFGVRFRQLIFQTLHLSIRGDLIRCAG